MVWSGSRDSAFLTSSLVVPVLTGPGASLERVGGGGGRILKEGHREV